MSDLVDEMYELLSFITFPITNAVSNVNFFGIQKSKIYIMHIQGVSSNLRNVNKIIHPKRNYYIQICII